MKIRLFIHLNKLKISAVAMVLMASVAVQGADTQQSAQKSWLREMLPQQTLLYARIPNIWNLFSAKDDAFKQALGSEQNKQLLTQLEAASQHWLKQSGPRFTPLLQLVAGQLNGPIEIAAVAGQAMPEVLISLPVKYSSSEQVQVLINNLIALEMVKGELKPLGDDKGILDTYLGPLPYHWDKAQRRVKLLVSFGGASLEALDQAYTELKVNTASPMLVNEQQMDSSTEGLYVWFNHQLAQPIYQNFLPPAIGQQLAQLGVNEIKSAAVSWAVHNAKGRFKIQLDIPHSEGLRDLLPRYNHQLTLATAGEPKLALLLGAPSVDQLKALENSLFALGLSNSDVKGLKDKFTQLIGVNIEQILKALGPELVAISDNSGEYLALKIRDREAFKALVASLEKSPVVKKESKLVNGKEQVHIRLAGLLTPENDALLQDVPYFVADLATGLSSHFYWQQEGDFIIVAELSQILQDRQRLLTNHYINLEQWLKDAQKQDLTASALALSGRITEAPKRLYYGYISLLQMLADITAAKIDTTQLPPATALNLAETGSYGLQLDSSDSKVALELVFESTPADVLLLAKGASTAAMSAAAIALIEPVFKEAKFHNMVTSAENTARKAKLRILGFYVDNKRFPNTAEAKQMSADLQASENYQVAFKPDVGQVVITFSDVGYQLANDQLIYTPSEIAGSLEWQCTSDVWRKFRPDQCNYK